jgi:hypothetical protein
MKKKIIISVLAVLFIGFLIVGYRLYSFYSLYKLMENIPDSDYKGRFFVKNNDDNFPDYLIQFMVDKDLKKKLYDLEKLLPEKDEIFDREAADKLVIAAEAEISSQTVDYFKQVVPIIKNKMKETKNSVLPSFRESENYPFSPEYSTMRHSVKYWSIMSRMLEHKKEYEASLLLSHAILYLIKDYQTIYIDSCSLVCRMIGISLADVACNSIMIWASRPKSQYTELSKEVAKDILDFVNNDYSLSNYIENEQLMAEELVDYLIDKGHRIFLGVRKSSSYKEMINLCYKEPMSFIDKPIFEIKKELEKFSEQYNKLVNTGTFEYVFYYLLSPERGLVKLWGGLGTHNFVKTKESYEASLAKMEMTAIALVINSFVCEKKKYPKSMDELSEWFGSPLPQNRITNEPYKLDFEGEHVLSNNSIKEKEFYFDFSIK